MDGEFEKKEFLAGSLKLMTSVFCKHYGRPVIVLLNEYDVSLDKAHQNHEHRYADLKTGMMDIILEMLMCIVYGMCSTSVIK